MTDLNNKFQYKKVFKLKFYTDVQSLRSSVVLEQENICSLPPERRSITNPGLFRQLVSPVSKICASSAKIESRKFISSCFVTLRSIAGEMNSLVPFVLNSGKSKNFDSFKLNLQFKMRCLYNSIVACSKNPIPLEYC